MSISDQLKEKGFTLGQKVCVAFDEIYPDILESSLVKPSLFIDDYWHKYKDSCEGINRQNLNGKIEGKIIH